MSPYRGVGGVVMRTTLCQVKGFLIFPIRLSRWKEHALVLKDHFAGAPGWLTKLSV